MKFPWGVRDPHDRAVNGSAASARCVATPDKGTHTGLQRLEFLKLASNLREVRRSDDLGTSPSARRAVMEIGGETA